jgi:sarcosine oxidase subunit beta
MLRADIAIVGGGLAGCSAALHMARAGLSVVLLDKGACGGQASGVNAGGVRKQGRDLAELPLAHRARALWARMAELVDADVEFEAKGHLKLARSEADMAELERYAATARPHGLNIQLIGRNALRVDYPWLGDAVVGASLCAEDGQANPRLVAPAFARAARRAGADIREHERVVDIQRLPTSFALTTSSRLEIRAAQLVNTAGAWSGEIAEKFGEPVPIALTTPNMAVTEPLPPFISRLIGVAGGGIYFNQTKRGNLVFGGGQGWGDLALERARPLPEVTAAAIANAVGCIPALAGVQVIRNWTGLEGIMPDKIPVIGPSRTTPGLWHAFGFSGHGFQLGPAVGAVLDELVREGATATPIAPFDIARFAQPPVARANQERK